MSFLPEPFSARQTENAVSASCAFTLCLAGVQAVSTEPVLILPQRPAHTTVLPTCRLFQILVHDIAEVEGRKIVLRRLGPSY